jgi:ectoine hydroxylase-related dioxygenase (phytanoyl-CoA dioxygenase family)
VQCRRHPLNRDFRWRSRRGPFRRISAEQASAYDDHGFFVLEDAFEPSNLDALLADSDHTQERLRAFLRTRPEGRLAISRANEITFAPHLVKHSPSARAFCTSPPLLDLAHDLLGPDVRLYWDQTVYKRPGTKSPFPWHQDNGYVYVEPQHYLTCWVALTDATIENGCPWVVPGAHRSGTLVHEWSDLGWVCFPDDPPEALPVPVAAGGIVVFSSLTPHATGANRTHDIRKAYIVQFAPEGAEILRPLEGAIERIPATDPERQFPVLVGGRATPRSDP